MEAPLAVTVSMAAKPKRSLDLRDMMDELPMLASLKDQKWMARLPRNMFPALKKSPRSSGDASPTASSDADTTLLSPGFLPTPRTARAMSVLVPSTDEEVLDALDPRFFTESFDPVAHMLDNIPENKTELNVFLRTEISAVDVAKDVILTKLQDDVRANYNSLIQGMKVVQEVDLDLVRAQIHVKNGRRLLATAKNDLILSSLEIVKTKRNRDRVSEIVSFGSQIVNFFDEEEKMNEALQEHRFITAVDICVGLRKGLSRKELQGLTILDEIRLRIQDFIPKLREQFDQSLRKVAGCFDPLGYKELLQAYITLADHSENLGFEFSSYTLNEVLSNIPEIIVRSIDDMTSVFMRQVFEAVSPKKLKIGIKNSQLKDNNASKPGDPVTPAFQTVENVKRCYEHLTDLMHTYYLLVQWHRDPFNPLNDDVTYLHRCGIDDDDDDDDDTDEDEDHDDKRYLHSHSSKHGHGSSRLKEPGSPSNRSRNGLASKRSLYDQVLCDTGMTLLRYRKIVWENIQQNVLEMIEKLDMTYGYKMEHIIALSLATTTFTEIGEEFTGAPSSKIRSVLRVKCEQYLHAFHDDNIELGRMLLDTENWLRVTASTTDGDDNAGLLRLIEKRSGYFFEQKDREDLVINPIYSRRVFPSFHSEGNPFSAANSMEWLSMKQGIRFHHEARNASIPDDKMPPRVDNQALPVMDPNESEFVLTSSSLAGFVRLCGVYLKMMEHLPHIGWEAFRSLNNLFEFNLYAVFTNFITADDIALFFRGRGGNLSRNDATRWNGLRTGICRIADEINAGEMLLQSSALIYPSSADNGRMQQQNSPMSRKVTLRKVSRTPPAVEDADESNLYALAERAIACEAIVGQCRLMNAIEELARSYLPDRYLCLMDEVYERNRTMVRELRSFMYNIIATKLVDVPALLDSVSAVSWDIPYISDQHNEYIVHLVQKCGEAWGGLQILADGSIPLDAREDIWAAMVQTIMDALLQAFSTVPKPTPQGRALMLLDLHALQNGLDLINHISSRTVPRGREYVGSYIKAFYYDEDELLEWIKANKTLYTKIQFANLLKNGIGPTLETKRLRELVLKIDAIIS
ncbi:Coiled-coil domain-containing protein [Phytophthora cinnamomi]|uniref:Coiled-coil domain-containing protein n=1 Tax=Phytophthora cinnamomi TaxID=4785 RepID=UPI0035594F0D|nr:Coiled-coil domain-containing protein [Phytophthora cinnamomi]